MRTPTGVYWLHGDHLGSASLTTDATGNRVGELRYLPYGETRSEWGVTPTGRRFTGQLEDSYIKLIQMGARWYDSDLGRWISPDSIVPQPGNPQTLNRYSYVNNPLKYADPTGHCPLCITAGIGAIAGGIVMGATYALTTNHLDAGQFAVVTLAGAGAGALIGSGVGIAAGMTAMSAATAIAVGGTLAGAGVGAGAAGEGYMASRVASSVLNGGQAGDFDTVDFAAAYTAGGVSGAIKGSPLGKTPIARIAADAGAGALQSALSDAGHGQQVSGAKVAGGAIIGAGTSALFEGWDAVSPIGPSIYSQWLPNGNTVQWQWTPGIDPRSSLDPRIVSTYVVGDLARQNATSLFRSSLTAGWGEAYDDWAERRYGSIQ